MPRIYIAGPLFNTHERWYLEQIASALEVAGYETFLPHRDAGLVDKDKPLARGQIFRADIEALDSCAGCIALLTGSDHDSGTSAELGYMYARQKPCIGITDDMRWMNNMIWGLCGEGRYLGTNIKETVSIVEKLIPITLE